MNITNDIWKQNDYKNLVELFEKSIKKYAHNNIFGTKNKEGVYEWVTYDQVGKRVDSFRGGLASLGVSKGDRVGIISKNRTEWIVAEMATLGLGAWFVPMYEKELLSIWKYIVTDAACKVLIVSTQEIYEQLKDLPESIPTLEKVIMIDGTGNDSMAAYEKIGKKNPVDSVQPEPKDAAVIIYTSGTTGKPKGVMLSHGNLCFASQAGYHLYTEYLTENTVSFSHLPWAHSYAISAELHNGLQFGGSIAFMDTIDKMGEDIETIRPTVLMSVPRVFNRIYKGIYKKIHEDAGIKLTLFNMAVRLAEKRFRTGKSGLTYALLNKIVLQKIRDRFGGRLTLALTASARMNEGVALFFYSIGIPTYDAYGLTETSPVITMNAPKAFKLGSVGKPVEQTRVVIDKTVNDKKRDDGEIVVYGPQVMLGYYNKPDETKKVLQEDGGLRTGDRGKLDEEGYLYITGRIKEQYKLQNGKYIFPASIEEDINGLPYVANSMVYGEGQEYNVCIVALDTENIEEWVEEMKLHIEPEELLSSIKKHGSDLKKYVCDSISASLKEKYHRYEIPRKYYFVTEDFTLENGLLTQTMKIKRKAIYKKYSEDIKNMYE